MLTQFLAPKGRFSALIVAAEKYVRLIGGFIATAAIARALGPEGFGILSFALSIVYFFGLLANFGLDSLLPNALIIKEKRQNALRQVLADALYLQASVAGVALLLLVVASSVFVQSAMAQAVIAVIAGLVFFQSHQLCQLYFNTTLSNRLSVSLAFVLQVLFLALKLYVCWHEPTVIDVALVLLAEHAALWLCLRGLLAYRGISQLKGHFPPRPAQQRRLRQLAIDAAPLVISGLAISVYNRLDQVMIFEILGESEAGQYAAAARLAEGAGFLSGIAISAIYPLVIRGAQSQPRAAYFTRYFRLLLAALIPIAVVVSLLAPWVVDLVFGQGFSAGAQVLPLMMASMVLSNFGMICTQWLVIEGKQIYRLYRTLAGVVLNIVLNSVLIPHYGLLGGALATLLSQLFVAYLSNAIAGATRHIFWAQTNALFFTRFNSSHPNP